MCRACWVDYGSPAIRNDRVLAAVAAIRELYELTASGGNLHVIVDDWNIDDEYFERDPCDENYWDADPEQLAVERRCFALLKAMTVDERASALALHDKFITGS